MLLRGPEHGRAVARRANAFLYCACMSCHCRVLKANPADIELHEMAHFVWTISILYRKAAVFPLPLLVFFPLNITSKVLKMGDVRLIYGEEHDITYEN